MGYPLYKAVLPDSTLGYTTRITSLPTVYTINSLVFATIPAASENRGLNEHWNLGGRLGRVQEKPNQPHILALRMRERRAELNSHHEPRVDALVRAREDRNAAGVLDGFDRERPEDVRVVDEQGVICNVPPHAEPVKFNANSKSSRRENVPSPEAECVVALVFRLGKHDLQLSVLV